jgi:hypothetical protein
MGRKFYSILFGAAVLLTGCSQQVIEGMQLKMTLKSEYGLSGNVHYTSTCKTGYFDCVADQASAVCLSKGVDELVWNANPPMFTCKTKKS